MSDTALSELFDLIGRRALGVHIELADEWLPYRDARGQEVHCWHFDGKYVVSRKVWDALSELAAVRGGGE